MNKPKWQTILKSGYRDSHALLSALALEADIPKIPSFPLWAPQPFVNRMVQGDRYDPLLLQILPSYDELREDHQFIEDPLQEQIQSPHQGMIHKYRNRLLLITTGGCALHCRYCFRRHFPYEQHHLDMNAIDAYIKQHTEIDEVILSGGDPLMLKDDKLHHLISHLSSQHRHIQCIRIHTRLPIVIPDRITEELIECLSVHKLRICLVFHINHPNEIDDTVIQALNRLPRSIHCYNQSVLLKNINDDARTLKLLSETLMKANIQPYYLHLLDPVKGAAHFHINIDTARAIYHELQASTSGYMIPKLCQEIPHQPYKSLVGNL